MAVALGVLLFVLGLVVTKRATRPQPGERGSASVQHQAGHL